MELLAFTLVLQTNSEIPICLEDSVNMGIIFSGQMIFFGVGGVGGK